MKINIQSIGENEVFTFFHYRFNVNRAWMLISKGTIRPKLIDYDITEWATQILHLKLGDTTHKPVSILLRLNYDHVLNINSERLKEPGLIVITKDGAIIIDGNHRLANLFMNGHTHMKMYAITEIVARKNRVLI